MSFKKTTVVITGASRGIGREIALEFARSTSHSLLLLGRDEKALHTVRRECLESGCENAESMVCDLIDSEKLEDFHFPETLPDPGILINNAGTFLLKPLRETTLQEFEKQWQIHCRGPFQLTSRLLPQIQKQERGLIVNISSVGALQGQPRSGAYSSSKHALLGWSRSLREELKGSSVSVTAINLGQTMSASWEGIAVDPQELIDPKDVALMIVLLSRMSTRTVAEEIVLRPQKGDRSPD